MRSNKGFTLLEVLIALMIVAGGIVALNIGWGNSFLMIRKSTMKYDVATLLERKMTEFEAKYKDKPITEIPEGEEGDFENDFPQYRWKMESRDLVLPDLTPLLISQQENPDEMLISMMKQMTEYLNKVIKEVKISVFVKGRGGKEVEFSVVQYFVDYTKDFGGLPAGGGKGK